MSSFIKPKELIKNHGLLKQRYTNQPFEPQNLGSGVIIGSGYDGDAPFLKLYDSGRVYIWRDTEHRPYCLYRNTFLNERDAIQYLNSAIGGQFRDLLFEKRFDALTDSEINVVRIVTDTPTDVAGKPDSIRNFVEVNEADIRYTDCFIIDRKLEPGMPYSLRNGVLFPLVSESAELPTQLAKTPMMERFFRLLEAPTVAYRRIAVDIEVKNPSIHMPDPAEAEFPIIACSLSSSDGVQRVLLLHNAQDTIIEHINKQSYDTIVFDTEEEMITEIFKYLWNYPIVLTFNGDTFDFRYLYHRAVRLGFSREEIPIQYHQSWMGLRYGIHLDLMRFFANMSIQTYAFGAKYKLSGRTVGLDEVAIGLLGEGKLQHKESIGEMSYIGLASYSWKDADLTFRLTSFGSDTTMKLLTVLSRVAYQSMEDISRGGASSWIKNLMLREHRVRGIIIPRAERREEDGTIVGGDILKVKNVIDTKSEVAGKKFRGAKVVEPVAGLHFNVSVLDFASLYPSIIETWNLGYETVRCPHKDCKEDNPRIVPFTTHWVCKKKRAMTAEIVGTLKDIRVQWYKPKGKTNDYYSVVEQTLKVFMNATYGVFSSDKFPLYCPPMGEAVTQIGRFSITSVIEEAKRRDVSVFYGDTDSVFMEVKPDVLADLIKFADEKLNMKLELDKTYKWLALSGRKKNYIGLKGDKVDIKGMVGKKRHTPEFVKSVFRNLLDILKQMQTQEDFPKVRAAIIALIHSKLEHLRSRKVSIKDLAFTVGLQRDPYSYIKTVPQHVKVALQIGAVAGDVIHFVKVYGKSTAKHVSVARLEEVNLEAYEEFLEKTLEQVLDCLGISWSEIDVKQSTLFGESIVAPKKKPRRRTFK